MSLREIKWFHPDMMDAAVSELAESIHRFMNAPHKAPLNVQVEGRNGLIIESSKHWEYTYAIQQSGLFEARNQRILDAGCGRSAFPAYLADSGVRVHGIDLNVPALTRLRPYGVVVTSGSLEALPYRDETFDQVFCISVLEHTPDLPRCFDELWRVTRLEGILTVTGDYAPFGLPTRTLAADHAMNRTLLRLLVGPDACVPDESPALSEGLGWFSQMWPTVLPVYLRFLKDTSVPPRHITSLDHWTKDPPARPLDPGLRKHLALQCYRAARIYLSCDWIPEARELFAKAWRLDHRLASALIWGFLAHLPPMAIRALRNARRSLPPRAGD